MIHSWSVLSVHWKDWCWSWNSNTLATWWEELTHLKRPCCWERLKQEGEGDDRGWDGWMASPTQWTWVWVSSMSWYWTGRPGVMQSLRFQRVRYSWVTELNWTNPYSLWTWVVTRSSLRSITLVHPSLPKFAPLKCHLSIRLPHLSEGDHYCYLAYILHNKLVKREESGVSSFWGFEGVKL